eukprot:2730891-Amphidinium_carterae.1
MGKMQHCPPKLQSETLSVRRSLLLQFNDDLCINTPQPLLARAPDCKTRVLGDTWRNPRRRFKTKYWKHLQCILSTVYVDCLTDCT